MSTPPRATRVARLTPARIPLATAALARAALVSVVSVVLSSSALPAQPRAPVIQERVTLDPRAPVSFHVLIAPDTVYVGEQATYELGVFISESARQRMRRNPEVVPAELRGVLAYDLGGPQSLAPITQQGVRSYPHVLQRAVFPLAPGRLTIPASRLTYTLPRSASFFSREESATLRGDEVELVVRPLPLEGRPADFGGAVGDLALRAQLDADSARVGEPLVLTVRVSGRGNVKLWPRPSVRASGVTLVPSSERVRVDSSGRFIRGSKEFDWLVTPERAGELTLPAVRYAYFDPWDGAYRVADADSLRVTVAEGAFVPPSVPEDAGPLLPLRRQDRGEAPTPWSRQPLAWALAALAPLGVAWRRGARRASREAEAGHARLGAAGAMTDAQASTRSAASPRATSPRATSPRATPPRTAPPRTAPPRNAPDPGAPASEPPRSATASGSTATPSATGARDATDGALAVARELRRRWYDGLAMALDASPGVLGERATLERRLRRRGVTRETTARVLSLAAELDALAWGPPAGGVRSRPQPREALVEELLGAVRNEAVPAAARIEDGPRRRRRGRAHHAPLIGLTLLAGLLGLAIGVGRAQPPTTAEAPPVGGPVPVAGVPLRDEASAFRAALAAFDAGDHAAATEAFLAVAERAPRHVDAWVNAGIAAWTEGDTVQAVRAWQRALRLDPVAADVRAQLQRLPSGSWQGVAAVPSVSPNLLTAGVLGAWLGGWVLLVLASGPPRRLAAHVDGRTLRRGGVLAVVAALGLAGWAWQLERHRTAAALAVVDRHLPLRVAPGRDANSVGSVATGDVVRRDRERIDAGGAERWVAVTHADGRIGWLPDAVLVNVQ